MFSFADVWPFHDLRLLSPRLELRPVRDEDIAALAAAAVAGIHEPDTMPFVVPWTRQEPEQLARGNATNVWRQRAELTQDSWNVSFAVLMDGVVIGRQDIRGDNFAELRTVDSGSWLTRAQQGHGLGKEMRAAVLLWAFDWLGAEFATTAAMSWNKASQGVSSSLGYRPNGEELLRISPGEVEKSLRFRLAKADFRRPEWELMVEGHAAVAPLLGAG